MVHWTKNEEELAAKQQQMLDESRRNVEHRARAEALAEAKRQLQQLRHQQQHNNSRDRGHQHGFDSGRYQTSYAGSQKLTPLNAENANSNRLQQGRGVIASYTPHLQPAFGVVDRQVPNLQTEQPTTNAATLSQNNSQSASCKQELTADNEDPAADGAPDQAPLQQPDGEAQLPNCPSVQGDNDSLRAAGPILPPYQLKITTEAAYKDARMKHWGRQYKASDDYSATDEGKAWWVQRLVEAMKDVNNVEGRETAGVKTFKAGRKSDEELEIAAWKLLVCVLRVEMRFF